MKLSRTRVHPNEIDQFVTEIHVLLKANMTLVEALEFLRASVGYRPAMRDIIQRIADEVASGGTLGESFAQHLEAIPSFVTQNVVDAESRGDLVNTLENTVTYRTAMRFAQFDVPRRIRLLVSYPIVVFVTLFLVFNAFSFSIIPRIENIFFSDDAEGIPYATRILFLVANNWTEYWYLYIAGVALLVGAAARFRHAVSLRMPIVRRLTILLNTVQFLHTFLYMKSSGAPNAQALDATAVATTNADLRRRLLGARDEVLAGTEVAKALDGVPHLPPDVIRGLNVGEKSGQLETVLAGIADNYGFLLEVSVEPLIRTITLALMVILAMIIGSMLLAIYSPIFFTLPAVFS